MGYDHCFFYFSLQHSEHTIIETTYNQIMDNIFNYGKLFQPTIAQWIELLTKQFNASQPACEVSCFEGLYLSLILMQF